MKSGEAYGTLKGIIEQNFHRSMKYAISGFVGFLFVEFITYVLFHMAGLNNLIAVTPAFLAGVAVEFSMDEFWTTRNQGIHTSGAMAFLHRMGKFEVLNFAGTIIAVIIQYILFVLFSLSDFSLLPGCPGLTLSELVQISPWTPPFLALQHNSSAVCRSVPWNPSCSPLRPGT